MQNIQQEELKRMITDADTAVINVLPQEEYEKRHIPGTINVPVQEGNFVREVESKIGGKDMPVVVYCASTDCDASEKAARKLEESGFSKVRDYAPGVKGWEESGNPVEGREAKQTT